MCLKGGTDVHVSEKTASVWIPCHGSVVFGPFLEKCIKMASLAQLSVTSFHSKNQIIQNLKSFDH